MVMAHIVVVEGRSFEPEACKVVHCQECVNKRAKKVTDRWVVGEQAGRWAGTQAGGPASRDVTHTGNE